jgi:OTU domain-containing protein 6
MADDDLDSLLARHKREQKALISQITSLKKTVTKGEKSKRKEVLAEAERLEKELKERHHHELMEVKDRRESGNVDYTQVTVKGGEKLTSFDPVSLETLKLDDPPHTDQVKSGKPKVNRQKARMVFYTLFLC